MSREQELIQELETIRDILALTPQSFGLRPEIDRINNVLQKNDHQLCPKCGAKLVEERCELICISDICRHLVVENCSLS